MYKNFVPNIDDPHFKLLENKIDAEYEPIILQVEPEENAKLLDCFVIVEEKIKGNGGKMILGWQIWKTNNLIEAECHAVWEDLNSELKDITPKPEGIDNILFIEDPKITYEGKQIDNIRINITKNKLVDHLIELNKAKFRLQNKGERANHYDLSNFLSADEKREIEYVVNIQNGISHLLNMGLDENGLCFCNSKKKYKNCHGKNFIKEIKKYK